MKNFLFPKFALHIHNIISFGFPKTFFVGGAVRNVLLNKKISDIDIATSAKPKQVITLLKKNNIPYSTAYEKFGVIVAKVNSGKSAQQIEIATFRKDRYAGSRYPAITFSNSPKIDSNRRDFTINALYYNPMTGELLDFHDGLTDLKKKVLKFIGNPIKRIQEDPLRIVRAYRFQLQYKLKFEKISGQAFRQNKTFLKKISAARVAREINALTSLQLRKQLQKVIHNLS